LRGCKARCRERRGQAGEQWTAGNGHGVSFPGRAVGNLNVALFFIVAAGMLKPAQPILARREGAGRHRAIALSDAGQAPRFTAWPSGNE
jgi:hypothetical protein